MNLTKFFRLMIIISSVIIVFSLTAYALAGGRSAAETLFQHANDLYGRGDFRQALTVYNKIAKEDGVSGPLLYNLGNCYAQLGRTGMAVLNYERALRLSPGDSDIRGNLDLVRKNQGLFQDERPLEEQIVTFFDLNQWTGLAGIFLVVFTVVCIAGLRLTGSRQLRRWVGGISLFIVLAASAGAILQYRQRNAAVVVGDEARILLSPFARASSIGTIKEGRIVQYESRHGDYALIEDHAGRSGWIAMGEIRLIEAPGSRKLLR